MYTNMYTQYFRTYLRMFKIHIYPRKILLEELNRLCPKWDFEQTNEKTQQNYGTTDD